MIRHRWDISPKEAIELQRRLAGDVRIEPLNGEVHTVAGVDCAFLDGGAVRPHVTGRRIIAVAVLCDARSMQPIERAHVIQPCRFPYIPGLLSFREAPAVIAAVRKLSMRPALLMCDGQGIAHPRGLGLASHVGLWLDVPTIGVAKSRLCGEHNSPGEKRGCNTRLVFEGCSVGAVVRTRTAVKPLYVSVGSAITLREAVRWTLRCGRGFRLPQPTRLAHEYVSQLKRQYLVVRIP